MGVHFVGVKGAEWRAEISGKNHSLCFILCSGSAFTFSFTFAFCLHDIAPSQVTYHDTCFRVSMTGVITGPFLFSYSFWPLLSIMSLIWSLLKRMKLQLQADRMGFLCRLSGQGEGLRVKLLFLHFEKSQLRSFGHLIRKPSRHHWPCPTGRGPCQTEC